jgi:hypothetical protein
MVLHREARFVIVSEQPASPLQGLRLFPHRVPGLAPWALTAGPLQGPVPGPYLSAILACPPNTRQQAHGHADRRGRFDQRHYLGRPPQPRRFG